ncbi:DsbA family oxidoreductase [Desulfitobacterium sp. AusDCA]|uniref:DsbA family oxidoreductase n=1 Tax=Desulfitobacterium sp. AusDCA TaxID=3240383 RepID=UPI003DA6EB97
MGNGIVNALKNEFDIEDHWMSYELHPETPPEGISLKQSFPQMNIQERQNQFNKMGAPYGIVFNNLSRVVNTHLALQASEFAREEGKFHEYHEKLLYANYTEGKNIGDINVLLELAQNVKLDPQKLEIAIRQKRYEPRLLEVQDQAEKDQIMATPTVIINDQFRIVGAQSFQAFRKKFKDIESGNLTQPFTPSMTKK